MPHDALPLLELVAPTSVIVYVVLTPRLRLAADSVGGDVLTVMVGEFTEVESPLVETVKLKLAVGTVVVLPAVKPTETVAPAATPDEHEEELRVMTNPEVPVVAPPLWRQLPETTLGAVAPETGAVATIAFPSESPMVIVPPEAIAAGETNVTV